jgi:osmotically-inducible protein OsmY
MSHSLISYKDGLTKHRTQWLKQPVTSRLAETVLEEAAFQAIKTLTTVPVESIQITAQKAWLRVEGTVDWRHQRTTIEDVLRNLAGVVGVTNLVTINSMSFYDDGMSWLRDQPQI